MLTSIKISTAVNILFYAVMLTNNESVFWNQHLSNADKTTLIAYIVSTLYKRRDTCYMNEVLSLSYHIISIQYSICGH
jgi:hypothetical protein